MNEDQLIKCIRSTANEGEFDRKKKVTEGLEVVKLPDQRKVMEDADEFVDDMYSEESTIDLETGDELEDAEGIAVIDTEITDEEVPHKKVIDYVGKYVVVCPVCLNALFSDEPSGSIYCPVCDEDMEIEEAAGKVVDPNAKIEDNAETEVVDETDIATDAVEDITDEVDDEVIEDNDKDESKTESYVGNDLSEYQKWVDYDMKKYGRISGITNKKIQDAGLEVVKDDHGDYEVIAKEKDGKDESKKLKESYEVLADWIDDRLTVDEADKFSKFDRSRKLKKIDKCPEGSNCIDINDKIKLMSADGKDYITDNGEVFLIECVEVKVCPEGSITVKSSEADAEVKIAPADKEEEMEVEVSEVDTDTFDKEITDNLSEIYSDEDITYESKSIKRSGKGLIIEGVIKSGNNSKSVKLRCTETKSKSNVFKLEGIDGTIGRFFIEGKYKPENKSFITESCKCKFYTKVDGKSVILTNRK